MSMQTSMQRIRKRGRESRITYEGCEISLQVNPQEALAGVEGKFLTFRLAEGDLIDNTVCRSRVQRLREGTEVPGNFDAYHAGAGTRSRRTSSSRRVANASTMQSNIRASDGEPTGILSFQPSLRSTDRSFHSPLGPNMAAQDMGCPPQAPYEQTTEHVLPYAFTTGLHFYHSSDPAADDCARRLDPFDYQQDHSRQAALIWRPPFTGVDQQHDYVNTNRFPSRAQPPQNVHHLHDMQLQFDSVDGFGAAGTETHVVTHTETPYNEVNVLGPQTMPGPRPANLD